MERMQRMQNHTFKIQERIFNKKATIAELFGSVPSRSSFAREGTVPTQKGEKGWTISRSRGASFNEREMRRLTSSFGGGATGWCSSSAPTTAG
eukprot:3214604-Rhodomonas_salina.1